MIVSNLSKPCIQKLKIMANMRPLPQVPAFEELAKNFNAEGHPLEAFAVFDILAQHYGKNVARAAISRFSGIPCERCGRGILATFSPQTHPALYLLRDRQMPLASKNYTYLRHGANLTRVSPAFKLPLQLHAFDNLPLQAGFDQNSPFFNDPISAIIIDDFLLFSNGSNDISCIDLAAAIPNLPAEIAQRYRLPIAKITFNTPVRRLCGPLNDGTFFATAAPQIPILSDECRLCRVDWSHVRNFLNDRPNDACNISKIGALSQNLLLPNIQQSLNDDCLPAQNHFLSCAGGMQNSEVRCIYPDGSWTTRFVHNAPVCRMLPTHLGPVSLDSAGNAFLWNNTHPVDDAQFALPKLPKNLQNLQNTVLSLDWHNKYLYLTKIDNPAWNKIFDNLQHFRIDNASASPNFILHVSKSMTLTADAAFHFWQPEIGAINPAWQLSHALASADDWREILAADSPCIEEDPRIRMFDFSQLS